MIPITEDLLPKGNKNRPGVALAPTRIVIHRTGNRNAPLDLENRNWWETDPGWHSAHYLVDHKTIMRVIPDNELAYHCIGANHYAIGIETCEPITSETYQNLQDLVVSLLIKYNLQPTPDFVQPHSRYDDVTRRFDPYRWVNFQAGKCDPNNDLFEPFTFYKDLKNNFVKCGGKVK